MQFFIVHKVGVFYEIMHAMNSYTTDANSFHIDLELFEN
jgi:hypothetical protein